MGIFQNQNIKISEKIPITRFLPQTLAQKCNKAPFVDADDVRHLYAVMHRNRVKWKMSGEQLKQWELLVMGVCNTQRVFSCNTEWAHAYWALQIIHLLDLSLFMLRAARAIWRALWIVDRRRIWFWVDPLL